MWPFSTIRNLKNDLVQSRRETASARDDVERATLALRNSIETTREARDDAEQARLELTNKTFMHTREVEELNRTITRLTLELADARKNDARDAGTGKFTKAKKG